MALIIISAIRQKNVGQKNKPVGQVYNLPYPPNRNT